jgi:uncharacterized protein (TIGR02246 family)
MMKYLVFLFLPILGSCCQDNSCDASFNANTEEIVSMRLTEMIAVREKAMIEKDIETAMGQFDEDSTWINSQGYFFEGKTNVLAFHRMLASNDSLDYIYEAGIPKVRVLDSSNAIAYYSWKMFWHEKESPQDIINREIGLMTLSAQKRAGEWYWIAVTNQHTPSFYDVIEPTTIDDDAQ